MTTLTIVCPTCAEAIPGETAEELVARAQRHIEQEHPELIGRYTDDDLLDLVQ
jgi:hypothetical protein